MHTCSNIKLKLIIFRVNYYYLNILTDCTFLHSQIIQSVSTRVTMCIPVNIELGPERKVHIMFTSLYSGPTVNFPTEFKTRSIEIASTGVVDFLHLTQSFIGSHFNI